MRSNAYIEVVCDRCQAYDVFDLTATAHGWDERNLGRDLEDAGWFVTINGDYCCSECATEAEAMDAKSKLADKRGQDEN